MPSSEGFISALNSSEQPIEIAGRGNDGAEHRGFRRPVVGLAGGQHLEALQDLADGALRDLGRGDVLEAQPARVLPGPVVTRFRVHALADEARVPEGIQLGVEAVGGLDPARIIGDDDAGGLPDDTQVSCAAWARGRGAGSARSPRCASGTRTPAARVGRNRASSVHELSKTRPILLRNQRFLLLRLAEGAAAELDHPTRCEKYRRWPKSQTITSI